MHMTGHQVKSAVSHNPRIVSVKCSFRSGWGHCYSVTVSVSGCATDADAVVAKNAARDQIVAVVGCNPQNVTVVETGMSRETYDRVASDFK